MWEVIREAPRYEINELGEIRSILRGTTPNTAYDKDGYLTVWLLKEKGKLLHRRVHRLVAAAFIPNPNGYPEVNHKNHVRDDNRVDNLEWCTTIQNVQDAKGHAVIVKKGEEVVGHYPSIMSAAKSIGLSDTMVWYCLKGLYKGARGYCFEYSK